MDRKQLKHYYKAYADMIYRLGFIYMKNTNDAEDVVQETFVASSLIQGLNPAEYNNYSMGGGATYYVENGICYMIVCCDSIDFFLNYDYESLTTGKIERLEQIGSTIDHNEFAPANGYYHIKYDEAQLAQAMELLK